MTNWGKNEDEDDKILEKEYGFSAHHPKASLYTNFYENLGKTFSVILTDPGKNEDKDEKIKKTSTNFEISTLKLDGLQNVIKIWGKKCFKCFLFLSPTRTFTWKVLISKGMPNHSHKKQKDGLETRAVLWIFLLEF